MPNGANAFAGLAFDQTRDTDAAFVAVVDEMASNFDLAPADSTKAPTEQEPMIAMVVPEAPSDLYPGLAYRLNQEADGIPDRNVQAPSVDATEDVPTDLYPGLAYVLNRDADGIDDVKIASADLPREEPQVVTVDVAEPQAPYSRAVRFSSAVHLTGQAVHAWLSLLQAPAVDYASIP